MLRLFGVMSAIGLALWSTLLLAQSNPYAPVVLVNDQIITQFELDQRTTFMSFLGATGNIRQMAEDALIEERLMIEASKRQEISVSQEELVLGMEQFAARGDLSLEELLSIMEFQGMYQETLEDFVRAALAWQSLVGARFGFQGLLSEAELDRSIASGTVNQNAIELRLSEIIIPYQSRGEEGARELAERLRVEISRGGNFDLAAAQYSEAPTAANGGVRDWISVSALSEAIAGPLLASGVGTLSEPIELGNAIAVFRLLGVRENTQAVEPTTIEFMTVPIPTGESVSEMLVNVDTCNDLRAEANTMSEGNAYRVVSSLERAVGQQYAGPVLDLDLHETQTLNSQTGQKEVLMICSRVRDLQEDARTRLRNALGTQRVESFGNAFLQELLGNATITRL